MTISLRSKSAPSLQRPALKTNQEDYSNASFPTTTNNKELSSTKKRRSSKSSKSSTDGTVSTCSTHSSGNIRRVTFPEEGKETMILSIIENASKLSESEKKERWVSSSEFTASKEECKRILERMSKQGSTDIFSYRGLEILDPTAIAKRQLHHQKSVQAVLEAQKAQLQGKSSSSSSSSKGGRIKPKELRKAYRALVMDSMKEAIENAYLDRKALEIELEDDATISSSSPVEDVPTTQGQQQQQQPQQQPPLEPKPQIQRQSQDRRRSSSSTVGSSDMSFTSPYKASSKYEEDLARMRRRWSPEAITLTSSNRNGAQEQPGRRSVLSEIIDSFPLDDSFFEMDDITSEPFPATTTLEAR